MILVKSVRIRGISAIEDVNIRKVLSVLVKHGRELKAQRVYYERLEIDEFRTYVGNKCNKVRLIYAYDGESGETVAYVRGKRNPETAEALRERRVSLGIAYESICSDDRPALKEIINEIIV